MFKLIVLTTYLALTSNSFAQVYDEEAAQILNKRPLNTGSVLKRLRQAFEGDIDPSMKRINMPLSILIDLQPFGLDEIQYSELFYIHNKFQYFQTSYEKAISIIEKIILIKNIPSTIELSAVISLASLYYKNKDYLNAIKYINRWHIYEKNMRHQLYYVLADSYLKVGDRINAYKAFTIAETEFQKYLNKGPDMSDNLGFLDYNDIVQNLKSIFANGNEDIINISQSPIDIPKPSNEFWLLIEQPKFPKAALRKSRAGYVIIKFDISINGRVVNFTIEENSRSIFNKPAKRFIERMKYIQYAQTNEEYIAKDVTYKINFIYEQ